MQTRYAELEEQQRRLEGQIRVSEQRSAAAQSTAYELQRANVHLRQELEAKSATVTSQVVRRISQSLCWASRTAQMGCTSLLPGKSQRDSCNTACKFDNSVLEAAPLCYIYCRFFCVCMLVALWS